MSARRQIDDEHGIITLVVDTGGTATVNYGAIFSTDDLHCTNATANTSACIGVFLDSGTAGDTVRVATGNIVPVAASGTCTMGGPAQVTATGFQDAGTWASGGGNVDYLYGTFMQTGTSGDVIGLAFCRGGTLEHS